MSYIKANHPEMAETSIGTDRIPVTGTYDSVNDKMSQDVNVTFNEDLKDVVLCLNKLNNNLEKLLIMVGEISGIEGEQIWVTS